MLTFLSGKYLMFASMVWPALFIVTCFIMFYTVNYMYVKKNDGSRQVPTFSETGSINPTDIVFTFGLHVEAFLLSAVFLAIYYVYQKKIDTFQQPDKSVDDDLESSCCSKSCNTCCGCWFDRPVNVKNLHFWNYTLLVLGLIASFFMAMVGCITLQVNSSVHGSVAFIMFVAAVLHLIIFYYKIAWFIETRTFRLRMYKLCLFMCIPFNLIVIIVFGANSISCSSTTCQSVFSDAMSVLEFTTSIFLAFYIFQFNEDIACISLGHVIDTTAGGLSLQPLNMQQQNSKKEQLINSSTTEVGENEVKSDMIVAASLNNV